jgi:putative transcription factor
MYCEICGVKIEEPHEIEIDGVKLHVCNRCARHGILILDRFTEGETKSEIRPGTRRSLQMGEISQGYAQLIRNAREERGWTQKELAKRINEKASLIGKMERGKMTPDDHVREKIEKLLGINLIENL